VVNQIVAELNDIPAIILAGGLGTRIRSILGDLPKPMAPILGRPCVEWLIRYLAKQGVRKVFISTGYRAEVIDDFARTNPVPGVTARCFAEPEPLGTGGGFAYAARASGEHPRGWLVINGDSFALAPLKPMADQFSQRACSGVIAGLEMADASRYGRLEIGENSKLIGFVEKHPGAGVINAGIYLLRPEVLDLIAPNQKASLEREVFPALTLRKPGLIIHRFNAPFLDIGTPESLALADAFVRQHPQFF
jgi:D-glycero-alpha-D-manno-heptose 1-phosphate guanylyltransferase